MENMKLAAEHGKNMAFKTSLQPVLRPFSKLEFSNRSLEQLPVDRSLSKTQRNVPNAVFALVEPTPVEQPRVMAVSESVAKDLLQVKLDEQGVENYLVGNVASFGRPAAHCYCGHQFGNFAGQLGDGATMYLGETVNSKQQRWELQYKGAGRTPFSRGADGRKVVRSSIREFLCSEHMFALGVPTTRALSVCTSQSSVVRDLLYDGNERLENCAVIIRVAETFVRFGSFEIARPTDPLTGRSGPNKDATIVKELVEYCIKHFYPQAHDVEEFINQVARKTASLVAKWQLVGFCHGVLNTDNMSIVGNTLDYGPFGFMERFDQHFICNRSDQHGRYTYHAQPDICLWNVLKLVETLELAGAIVKKASFHEAVSKAFWDTFQLEYREGMAEKLGIVLNDQADELFRRWFQTMQETAADFTMLFRVMSWIKFHDKSPKQLEAFFLTFIRPCLGDCQSLTRSVRPRYNMQELFMLKAMMRGGREKEIQDALGISLNDITREEARAEAFDRYSSWSEQDKQINDKDVWMDLLSFLVEHFEPAIVDDAQRKVKMDSVNPRFVLRNHVAQRAIELAEKGEFEELNKVLYMCVNPFEDSDELFVDSRDGFRYDAPSTDPSKMCAVSCSS